MNIFILLYLINKKLVSPKISCLIRRDLKADIH